MTIPLFVVEEHHEAFLVWHIARQTGLLPSRGNALLHVDEHTDHTVPRLRQPVPAESSDIRDAYEFTYHELSCAEFIVPALHLRVFDQFVWLGHGREPLDQLWIVKSASRKDQSFELNRYPVDGKAPAAMDLKAFGGSAVRYRAQSSSDPLPQMDNVVLDIDLDYFSCDVGLLRPLQLEIARHEYDEIRANPYHYLRISQGSRLSTSEVEGRYYLHLNAYGDQVRPARRVDEDTIVNRVNLLVGLLQRYGVVPRLIDVARSRHSGYTPWDQCGFIESALITALESLYDLEYRSLDEVHDAIDKPQVLRA